MSGFGERFRRAGISVPKALIEIDGKCIVAHVIEMFPGESDFLFICNNDHLTDPAFNMEAILRRYCPTGRIVGIPPHKLGPVHAICKVEHLVDPDRPVIINYCDFSCYWDWKHFKQFVTSVKCQGAIPAYKGFHPHTLGNTNYAYLRESDGWVLDIQEKLPYTNNRMEEYASSGTYYFASGKLMRDAFHKIMDRKLSVAGEYYVSLAYKPLLIKNQPIAVYPLQHFMQWGTPEDVAEYKGWSAAFKRLGLNEKKTSTSQGSLIVPMAGLGQRFSVAGYTTAKPLISVSGKPMVLQATSALPPALHHVFVLRSDMPKYEVIKEQLLQDYPAATIETIPSVTEGQACTALIGLDALQRNLSVSPDPVTFGACDNGMLYDADALQNLFDKKEVDVIVWGIRGHSNAIRHPQMYGWIETESALIKRISVKKPLREPTNDPIVLGTFSFRRATDFRKSVERLFSRDGRINGEFYIDSCINDAIALGLRCYLFEVDSFLSWGTPNDLLTFEYWQSCFDQWPAHSYQLEHDQHVPNNAIDSLKKRYQVFPPSKPNLPPPSSSSSIISPLPPSL
jgi:NDP-sugar pyrophosphorylase family protein